MSCVSRVDVFSRIILGGIALMDWKQAIRVAVITERGTHMDGWSDIVENAALFAHATGVEIVD